MAVTAEPLPKRVLYELESSLILLSTGVSRHSAEIIEQQIHSIESPRPLEAMHRLKQEAEAMRAALACGVLETTAQVLRRGWEAKKATSSAVSNDRIDRIYELAMDAGARAGKVSGAGGGGFMLFLVDPVKRSEVIETLAQATGNQCSPARFTSEGVASWTL